jgi:phosphoribosylglycinamide formyltransferase-1
LQQNFKITNVAIFASGAGTNAQKIIDYFENSKYIRIALIVCNNPHAGVLKIAEKNNIDTLLIDKKTFNDSGYVFYFKEKKN